MSLAGQTLSNRWQVGKMIGEGACAKVYSIAGPQQAFECVVKVIDLPKGSGKSKKDKEQSIICNTLHLEYMLYVGHLWDFPQKPQLPEKFYADDLTHNVRYLVMERFERDLVGYAEQSALSPADIAAVGQQLLMGLRWIHSKGFLFVDVKPGNFMMKGSKVYFIDYGLAQRFQRAVPGAPPCSFNGTPSFASIACMEGQTPAYRDDLEAMCYVLISMINGGQMPYPPGNSHQEVLNTKKTFDLKAYCIDNNVGELFDMVEICRILGHDELPTYETLGALLKRMSTRKSSSSNAKKAGATAAVAKKPVPVSKKRLSSAASSDTDVVASENDCTRGNKALKTTSPADVPPLKVAQKRAPTAAAKRKAEAAAAAAAAEEEENDDEPEVVAVVPKKSNVRAKKAVAAPVPEIDLTENPEPVAKKATRSRATTRTVAPPPPPPSPPSPLASPASKKNSRSTSSAKRSGAVERARAGTGAGLVLTSPPTTRRASSSEGSNSPKRALASGAKRAIAAKLAIFDGDGDEEAEKMDNYDAPPNSASKPRARPSVRSLVRTASNNSSTSSSAAAAAEAMSPILRGRSTTAKTAASTASY